MDSFDSSSSGGSLQISTEVIEKIARFATLEVEGVADVVPAAQGGKTLLGKITAQVKPVQVELKNDVADIQVAVAVDYGVKIPDISTRIQRNVKEAVQNMTSISVARVDVVISGLRNEA